MIVHSAASTPAWRQVAWAVSGCRGRGGWPLRLHTTACSHGLGRSVFAEAVAGGLDETTAAWVSRLSPTKAGTKVICPIIYRPRTAKCHEQPADLFAYCLVSLPDARCCVFPSCCRHILHVVDGDLTISSTIGISLVVRTLPCWPGGTYGAKVAITVGGSHCR